MAVLAVVRLFQERLRIARWIDGGEIDELMRSFLGLMEAYVSEIHPALKRALARAQAVPLPRGLLDELMAADTEIHQGLEPANAAIVAMGAAGADKAQIPRRSIAAIEHLSDEARALTRRIDRLLEEFESGRSDEG